MKKSFFSRLMDFFRELFTPRTPTEPTTPTTPTVPSEPTVPETPTTPTEPETPTTPEVPEEPTTPETPTEPPVVVEPEVPVDNRNESAFTASAIGDVYVGEKASLLFSLKGTIGTYTYPIDYADVDVEYINADGMSVKTDNVKTQPYGSTNEGTIAYTFLPDKAGNYTIKMVFEGDNLYKGCEITKVIKAVDKPVVVTPPVIGDDVTNPTVPVSVIERMGVNTTTGKLTIGGKDVTDLIQGVNDSTLLAYAIMGFLNGETSVRGKNQVFPKFQGTITCSTYKELFIKYFAYMKKYGLKVLRVGGHDIWGTGLQYNAWKDKRDAFLTMLKTMAEEAANAGVYLILVLGGTQDYPAFTYGGTGDVFDPASTAFAGYKAYVKDVMGALESYNGIGLFDMFNEPDHDKMGSKYWTSHGGKAAFNLWANSIASATNGFSTHPRCMGVAGLGSFFAWGQADFNQATGDVALECLDRHFYASAQDAYLFTDPQAWAKAKNKPLIWTEVGYNGIYPEGYWPNAVTALKSSGGQMICWMSLNAYPNYPNLTIETSSPSNNDSNNSFTITPNGTNYDVKNSSDTVVNSNPSLSSTVQYAIQNSTKSEGNNATISLVGNFLLDNTINLDNYISIKLNGEIALKPGSNTRMLYANGKTGFDISGGKWEHNGNEDVPLYLNKCSKFKVSDLELANGKDDLTYFLSCNDANVSNIYTHDCAGSGIGFVYSKNCTIENNHVSDVGSGIYCYAEDDKITQDISNIVIRGNTVERTQTTGIEAPSLRGPEDIGENYIIENNTVIDGGMDGEHPGIMVGWGGFGTVAKRYAINPIVRNNKVSTTGKYACDQGIDIKAIGGDIYGNIVTDATTVGILIRGDKNKLHDNTVIGGRTGMPSIEVWECSNSSIIDNTIIDPTGEPVWVVPKDAETAESVNNIISGNNVVVNAPSPLSHKYKVISNSTNYNVLDADGNIKYFNTNPATAVNWALSNLTANRATKEKILLEGEFPIAAPLKPLDYTAIELKGKVRWAQDTVGLLFYAKGKKFIEVIGGEWDANQKIRTRGGMDSGAFLFDTCTDIDLKNGENNKLYVHDTAYGNVRTLNCVRVHINGVECGFVGDYGKTTDLVRAAWRGPGMNLFNTNDSIVENCYIHDTASGGCYFYTEDDGIAQTINNNIMRNNRVERCLTSGLSLSTRGVEDKVDGGLIENNICIDCGEDGDHPGINIGWGGSRLATNTTVRNNQVYTTRGLCEAGIEFAGDGCICENNDCHDLGGPSVHVVGKNNKIINNKANKCGSQGYDGMMVEGTGGNTITGNTITNSTRNGIGVLDSNNNIITGNTIEGYSGKAVNIISGTGNIVN